jgi:DeoR family fructose operon transcriptional repressor
MNFQTRKQKILEKLNAEGQLDIKVMAAELGTSEITLRRDVTQLAADGMLYRTHGGAMRVNPQEIPYGFINKTAKNSDVKDRICRAAANEIIDGDIIFMDCGSTVFRLCQFIRNKKIKVITNSMPVVFELQNSSVSLNIVGGEFDAERQAVHGKIANEHIARYRATKAFLGVDGISIKGLFANSELEAGITQAFIAKSQQTFLLCDESKIGKETYLKFAEANTVGTIITNAKPPAVDGLRDLGVRIIAV